MKDAEIIVYNIEYGHADVKIKFKEGTRIWTIKHFPSRFSSPKVAENQAIKLAKKLGLKITETIVG